jgi:glutathione S-transferase
MVLKFMVRLYLFVFRDLKRSLFYVESRAICRYLEMKYKGKGNELIPKDIKGQGLFEQAASTETSYFDPYVSGLVYEKAFKKYFLSFPSNSSIHFSSIQNERTR